VCTLHRGEHAQREQHVERRRKREEIKDREEEVEIGRRERERKRGGRIDRHLFILNSVFARLHEVHIINTRGNRP